MGFHCCPMSKCTGTMRSPELEVFLSSGFHVQWSVLALQVLSMEPLILLWLWGTMEEEASGACGRRCRLEQTPIFNLCPVEATTEDRSAVSACDLPKPALHALLPGRNLQNTARREAIGDEKRQIPGGPATRPRGEAAPRPAAAGSLRPTSETLPAPLLCLTKSSWS